MAPIRIAQLISFSSEDRAHPAENLLNWDEGKARGWKCSSPGEAQATVVLRLPSPVKISSIDVGNNHSAFVEILVGRSGSTHGIDVIDNVLLPMASFMSPSEARNGENSSRVRMFSHEQLNKTFVDDKWDLVKVVCTQPFNKRIQYGLAFVQLHSGSPGDSTNSPGTTLGAFRLRDEESASSSNSSTSIGSLFARIQKQKAETAATTPTSTSTKLSVAAAIRGSVATTQTKQKKTTVQSEESQKLSKTPKRRETESSPKRRRPSETSNDSEKPIAPKVPKIEGKEKHPATTKRPMQKTPRKVSFEKLFDGIVIALSGYQNPLRSEIRQKALDMGAQYKADWNSRTCTHLICAFKNTPKANQIRSSAHKSPIVSGNWIIECYSKQKRLPWKEFLLDPVDANGLSDGEEFIAGEEEMQTNSSEDECETQTVGEKRHEVADDDTVYDIDTDDEIQRFNDANKEYDADTDVDEPLKDLPPIPRFWHKSRFALCQSYSKDMREAIERRIVAYGGILVKHPSTSSTLFAVISDKWDDDCTEIQSTNPKTLFLTSNWIEECDAEGRSLPTDEFLLH